LIRAATPADIPAMRSIAAQAATAPQWDEHEFDRLFDSESSRLVVVIDEPAVQGFVVAHQIGPEWELESIAVAPDAQRRGLASALLQHLLETVKQRGGDSVFLEVRESNVPARALYSGHGFVETGRRPRYYQDPDEAAVLYRKVISSR
jgi:[ribosomal protein S18]-alanine N-acetyltransferase